MGAVRFTKMALARQLHSALLANFTRGPEGGAPDPGAEIFMLQAIGRYTIWLALLIYAPPQVLVERLTPPTTQEWNQISTRFL